MKLSVSLTERDIEQLDEYAREHALPSRSAALREAVGLLSHSRLESEYELAWEEWEESPDRESWELAAGDGLD